MLYVYFRNIFIQLTTVFDMCSCSVFLFSNILQCFRKIEILEEKLKQSETRIGKELDIQDHNSNTIKTSQSYCQSQRSPQNHDLSNWLDKILKVNAFYEWISDYKLGYLISLFSLNSCFQAVLALDDKISSLKITP